MPDETRDIQRVLLLAPRLVPRGTSECSVHLAREMHAQGVDVRVFCGPGAMVAPLEEAGVGVDVFAHMESPQWHPATRRRLVKAVQEFQPDVVHAHSGRVLDAVKVLSVETELPLLLTLHARPAHARGFRRLCKSLRGVIAATQDVREELVNQCGFDRRKVHVIPNGIDVDRIATLDVPPVFGAAVPVVGSLGPVEEQRGHELFVQAVSRLVREGVRAQFVVAGVGDDVPGIRKMVKHLGLEQWVTMACDLSSYDDVLGALDIVVHASQVDVSGYSILFAMGYERAVVAFNTGTACEIIKDGKNGVLVNKGDAKALAAAMRSLLEDTGYARELAQAARESVAARFNIRTIAGETLDYYARLLDDGSNSE